MSLLADVPAVDAHCHAFDLGTIDGDVLGRFTLSEETVDREMVASTLLARRLIKELAAFLGCDATPDAVNEVRGRSLEQDRDAYVASLFADAGVEALLCDTGHPATPSATPAVELDGFARAIGRPCFPVFRVELAAERLMRQRPSFGAFIEALDAEIDGAVVGGAVALKSIIAYRTGLDVAIVGHHEAERAFDRIAPGADIGQEKALCDHIFVRAIERCIEHQIPLQIHSGMGDGPRFDMTLARPILLRRLLFDPAFRRAKLVLTHAGYPWVEETGWLLSQYDNVYADISEMVPFASSGLTNKLLGLLEMAPTTKLIFGTDGFGVPEMHWLGTKLARESLGQALGVLNDSGWLDAAAVDHVARDVMHDNAERLYRLDR